MLRKLLKYDIKEVGMGLLPLYGIVLVLAAIVGITGRLYNGVQNVPLAVTILSVILAVLFFMLLTAMAIMTLFLIVKNYRANLFGNRGYLMNTLPVKASLHVFDKTIIGMLWTCASMGIAILSAVIMVLILFTDNIVAADLAREIKSVLAPFGGSLPAVLAKALLLLLFWAVSMVTLLFASLSIGNLWKEHRVLGAILAFAAIGIIKVLLAVGNMKLSNALGISFTLFGNGSVFSMFEAGNGFMTYSKIGMIGLEDFLYAAVFTWISCIVLRKRLNLQ